MLVAREQFVNPLTLHQFLSCLFLSGIECDALSPIPNGGVSLGGTNIDDEATYYCNNGFTLVGDRVRRCLPSGQWSRQEPYCSGKFIDRVII